MRYKYKDLWETVLEQNKEVFQLLCIMPEQRFDFTEDDIILIKLAHGLDVRHINKTNPYLKNKDDAWPELTLMLIDFVNMHGPEALEFCQGFLDLVELKYCGLENPYGLTQEDVTFEFIQRNLAVACGMN